MYRYIRLNGFICPIIIIITNKLFFYSYEMLIPKIICEKIVQKNVEIVICTFDMRELMMRSCKIIKSCHIFENTEFSSFIFNSSYDWQCEVCSLSRSFFLLNARWRCGMNFVLLTKSNMSTLNIVQTKILWWPSDTDKNLYFCFDSLFVALSSFFLLYMVLSYSEFVFSL